MAKARPTWRFFDENSDFHQISIIVLAICCKTAGDPQIAGRTVGWSNSSRKRSTVVKIVVVQSSGVVCGLSEISRKIRKFHGTSDISWNMRAKRQAACQACARRGPTLRVLSRGHMVDGLPRASNCGEWSRDVFSAFFNVSSSILAINLGAANTCPFNILTKQSRFAPNRLPR